MAPIQLAVSIEELELRTVFTVEKNQELTKGGKKANEVIYKACEKIEDRFLCYYWKTSDKVLYVGSVTKDYKDKTNNLIGRIGNYLQNHHGTTNKRVFETANDTLKESALEFGVFSFKSVTINQDSHPHAECIQNGDMMYMIENILIGYFKSLGECIWNR